MPPVSGLTTPQTDAIRSGGYAGEVRLAFCPNTVVFQCEVTQTITNSVFAAFTWGSATVGAYTDVNAGQTVFITATDDPAELRNPLFRGRARLAPDATTFYVNESSFNLQTGYIVTVIDTYEILQRDRNGLLYVDYSTAYEDPPPMVKNMQAFNYFEDDTEGTFSFAPVGQAMRNGGTVTAYHWTIPGASYTAGNADTQNITFTIPAGHVWAFLDITDDNDVTGRFIFQILVCDRDDPDFMYEAHDNVRINSEIDAGLNTSVTYFQGVTEILDRTRVAIIAFDNYKSGDTDLFSNVMFVGYFVSEETGIAGDENSSTLAQTGFEIQSFGSIAAQLPAPQLAIRSTASPDAWDELDTPTTQRIAAYLICRYSTLGTLCSIDWITTDSTWFTGDYDLQGQTLLETINRLADEINAHLVFYPAGDAALETNPNFMSDTDRDALPELITGGVLPEDLFAYSMPLPYYATVGQVEAGFASFQTDGTTTVKLDAVAPAVARQEGNETPVVPAQLLPADLSQADAITAAKTRVADLLAYSQPPEVLNLTFHDGWRFLTVSNQVWLTFDLPATDNTRGIAITTAVRYLLQSLSFTWGSAGAWDISGVARLETQGGQSQVSVTIAPEIIETDNPVLAILADNDAFPPDGSLNFQSTDPDAADEQPYNAYNLGQYTPMTTEDAANAADNTPGANCAVIKPALNFKTGGVARLTPHATVNGETYTVNARGFALLSAAGWHKHFNFVSDGAQSWNPHAETTYVPGSGFEGGFGTGAPGAPAHWFRRFSVDYIGFTASTFTRISMTFQLAQGTYQGAPAVNGILWGNGSYTGSDFVTSSTLSSGTITQTAVLNETIDRIDLSAYCSDRHDSVDGGGTVILQSLTCDGTGTPPPEFTGATTSIDVYGDAFWTWTSENPTAELLPGGEGLNINNTPVSVPPAYDPNHAYQIQYTGDGNQTSFTYFLPSYSGVQNTPLYLAVCGSGMAT